MCIHVIVSDDVGTDSDKLHGSMEVSLFVWLFILLIITVIVCLRVYLRRTVYCRVTDRLDDKTVLITGQRLFFPIGTLSYKFLLPLIACPHWRL